MTGRLPGSLRSAHGARSRHHPRGVPARRAADRGIRSRCPPSSNCSRPSSPPGCARSRRPRSSRHRRCPHSPTPRRWPPSCPGSASRTASSSPRWSPGPAVRAEPSPRAWASIEYVVSAADGHSQANVGRSTADSTHLIADIARIAHENDATIEVIIATAWDCPFDGPTDPRRVLDIATAAVELGADRVAIADTIGTTTPRRVTALVERLRPVIGDLPLGAHFHNTRGAGLASAYAAVTRRGQAARRVGRRSGRLPVRPRRQRQHRHRGPGVHAARQRHRGRRRPAGGHPRGGRRAQGRRPRPAKRAAARRRPHPELTMPCRRPTHRQGPPDPRRHRAARRGSSSPSADFTARHWPTSRRRRASRPPSSTGTTRQGRPAGRLAESLPARRGEAIGADRAPAGIARRHRVLLGGGHRVLEHVQAEHRHHGRRRINSPTPNRGSPTCRTSSAASAWTSSPRRCFAPRTRATAPICDPEHTGAAISLLFENFTAVYLRPSAARTSQISDEDAIATLSTIWKKTLYGF